MEHTQERALNIAMFCDYENVALGARDARYGDLDIALILERVLGKGKIVVKKAYADWHRYAKAVRPLHEAGCELISIPHVSYSGKNSADIRLVVDALDMCYTKTHVDAFVIVSGDSDFSPLVSKLRENNKIVIGLGVKNSSSDLLIENCDDFIYYDDLVKRKPRQHKAPKRTTSDKKKSGKDGKKDAEDLKIEALDLVLETVEALFVDREDNVWGSMVKQTLKRKKPNFSETFHGYRSFNELLEDAQQRKLLELQKDERSGGYVIIGFGPKA